MKTEDFDDAVRRKIQSVNSPTSQKDIDRVYNYVNQQKTNASKRNYFLIGLLFLLTIGILGLSTWNVFQFQNQAELKNTIEGLKIKLLKSEIENNKSKANNMHVGNHLAENSSTNSSTSKKSYNSNQNNVLLLNTTENDKGKPFIKKSNQIIYKTASVPNGNPNSKINSSLKQKTVAIKQNEKDNLVNVNIKKTDSELTIVEINKTIAKTEEENNVNTNVNSQITFKTDSITTILIDKSIIRTDSLLSQNSLKETKIGIENKIDSNSTNDAKATPFLPSIGNWKYQTGLGFEVANTQLGFSVLGEVVFKKHWVFDVGLKYLSIEKERFDDDDDYHHHKNKDFKSSYEKQVTDSIHRNIKINNSIIQIPLNFGYCVLLKNNFSLIFGVGTDLDLSVKQHVEYQHPINFSESETKKFNCNNNSLLFNNTVISAGLQKQFKQILLQVSPFLSPQLKKVDYKKEDIYYGLRVRAFYSF